MAVEARFSMAVEARFRTNHRPWMAVVEVELFAPLRDAEHRSAKREQGAHV